MPTLLSSLLQRTRTGILMLLLVVLPLQGALQWVAGLQGQRHVHTGAHAVFQPLRQLLDHLHAAQDPRLQAPRLAWIVNQGAAAGRHQHGGVFHQHDDDTADVLNVGGPDDDAGQRAHGGATAFLAWLPAALLVPAAAAGNCPQAPASRWQDCAIAPPLAPPRG